MATEKQPKTRRKKSLKKSGKANPTLKQRLVTSEAINQTLMDISPFPITITRLEDGRFLFANQRHLKISGFSREEIIGKTPQELKLYTDPQDRERIRECLRRDGCLDRFETKLKMKDGRLIYAKMSGRIIDYEGQECLLAMTTYVDTISKAQQALRESENRFSHILNSITESYYEVDLKGRFTFFNNAMLTLFGCSADELMGLSYQDYTSPEDARRIAHAYLEVYREVVPVTFVEYGLRRKDGTVLQVEVSASLLRDNTGKPIGYCGINRDRTQQKKSEEALRRSEEKYRTILEEMEEGYWECDIKGNYTFFNEASLKIHGYSAEELMGMNYRQYLRPEQAVSNLELFREVYQNGHSIRIQDYEIIRKDGSVRYAEISGYPLRDPNGKIIGFWGISRDRTEHRQAEKALKESEEQYRLLVQNANDAIYITQAGRIKFHNPKTAALSGLTSEELAAVEFVQLVHPEDRKGIYEIQQRKLEDGQIPDAFAFRIFTKERKLLWVELSAVGITWRGAPATLNFLRDVTHQKKIESKLLQTQKMEAMGTLAGGIAHDFNNILSAIIGYSELCFEDADQGTMIRKNLKAVLTAGHRAKELVRQILAFARQSEEKLESIMVSVIAKEVLKLIRSSIPSTIQIESNIRSNAPILGNPTQVHQIIMNLCTNAAHAMELSGGILRVNLEEDELSSNEGDAALGLNPGNYLRLSVSDTGCGIAPEILQAIFEPYFTTKEPGEGTGMGLSVVQGIVEKYGGKITVQSEVGQGTNFTVYLPVSSAKAMCTTTPTEEKYLRSEMILYVDDEEAIIDMGSQILSRLGYQVTTRTSSVEALALFRSRPDDFNLVITDMTMPQMTGDQMALEMMRIKPSIPVILCTGYSKKITEEMAIKIGVKALIYKPIVKSELAATIRKVLDQESQKNGTDPLTQ